MILIKNCNLNEIICDILILNGKIIKIGKITSKTIREIIEDIKIKEIDGHGKKIIPGYIDNHVHIIGGGGEGGFTTRVPETQLSELIKNGITCLVGVLGNDSITRSVENLVAKTKALNEEGITAYCLTGAYEFPSPTITGKIQKDIVFINEIIGAKIAISDHRGYNPTKEDLIKLISEVRVASLLSNKPGIVNIHVGWGKGNMDNLLEILEETNIPIKHLRPTHISNNKIVFEQAMQLTKMGGFVDITSSNDMDKVIYYIKKAESEGDKNFITISSDGNGSIPVWENKELIGIKNAPFSLHLLIKTLVEKYNYKLRDAIKYITTNPSVALNLPTKGDINVNKEADIILLDDDNEIDTVIAKGDIMMLSKKMVKKGVYEKP